MRAWDHHQEYVVALPYSWDCLRQRSQHVSVMPYDTRLKLPFLLQLHLSRSPEMIPSIRSAVESLEHLKINMVRIHKTS